MNKLFFEKINEYKDYKYVIKNDGICRELSEYEMIEIMVSILRAQFEISYLKDRKESIFKSAEVLPIVIFEKHIYGLKVILEKNILFQLFDCISIVYECEEFALQCEEIYKKLNEFYCDGDVDFKIFSPIYLEHMLGVDIPKIEKVEYTRQKISSLFFYSRNESKKVRITEHEVFKQIQRGILETGHKNTNHIFESNDERIRNIIAEVKERAETYAAVVYSGEDVVRDGTHRLACLYYLYGDIEVPVIQVFVTEPYYSYTMYRAAMNNIEMDVIK